MVQVDIGSKVEEVKEALLVMQGFTRTASGPEGFHSAFDAPRAISGCKLN